MDGNQARGLWLWRQIAGNATQAAPSMMLAFKKSVQAALDFEKAMAQMASVFGGSQEELAEASKRAIALARQSADKTVLDSLREETYRKVTE
jgi:hypothetical protein